MSNLTLDQFGEKKPAEVQEKEQVIRDIGTWDISINLAKKAREQDPVHPVRLIPLKKNGEVKFWKVVRICISRIAG